MFENLTDRLNGVLDRLKRRGALSERDVEDAMREIRIALLEADVALPVVKDFVAKVKERAVGQEVVKSVTLGQMVVKIVNDHLVELLGGDAAELAIGAPPSVIMMVGLQGSGKTTSSAKLAKLLQAKHKKKTLLASLDVQRPAAQRQLEILADQVEAGSLPIIDGQAPVEIARRALERARREGIDVLILDTAGRLHVDDALMAELEAVRAIATPQEILLVADALTGQDAVNVAQNFHERIGITGILLTRMDGDARGGAALSMRAVTGQPIKFVGMGEKLDALEAFHPDRMASRILDMGDVLSLVEEAAAVVDRDEAEKLAKKMQKGRFDLEDFRSQLKQLDKMGGMQGILGKLPGMGKLKGQVPGGFDDSMVKRQCAIIDSMTKKERRDPKLVLASRRKRIARGSGTSVQDVNKLLKQHRQMQDMMKKMKKAGGAQKFMSKMMPGGMMPPGGMLPPGGMPR